MYKELADLIFPNINKTVEDYKAMYCELILQEDMIEQVWDAYMRLEEPYYSIINRMYVQSMLYAVVEQESGWSRQVFEKKRKKSIFFWWNQKKVVILQSQFVRGWLSF